MHFYFLQWDSRRRGELQAWIESNRGCTGLVITGGKSIAVEEGAAMK